MHAVIDSAIRIGKPIILLVNCLLAVAWNLQAQTPAPQVSVVSIKGRVTTADGKPLAGVLVLMSRGQPYARVPVAGKAITDEEGRYHLQNVPVSGYTVTPIVPAYVLPRLTIETEQGRDILLKEGQDVENFDFTLTRGGVISGQITLAQSGQPLVETRVDLLPADAQTPAMIFRDYAVFNTDDRGAFRFFGVPPGRYKVCVGEPPTRIGLRSAGGFFRRSCYPDGVEEAKAEVIEVKEGSDIVAADIRIGAVLKTYSVKARLLDGSGRPIAGMQAKLEPQPDPGKRTQGLIVPLDRFSDERGELSLDGLLPGRYQLSAQDIAKIYQTDRVSFEVTDADLPDMEVRVRRSASISGVVVIESAPELNAEALLPLHGVEMRFDPAGQGATSFVSAPFNADGTFQVMGLSAGTARIPHIAMRQGQKRLTRARVEYNGVEITDGLEIKDGEQLSGLKLVLTYGTGVIRGQIHYENGTPPPTAVLVAYARRVDAAKSAAIATTRVDPRGQFGIGQLPPGEYEISFEELGNKKLFPVSLPKQKVTVDNGNESRVSLTVDLQNKDASKETPNASGAVEVKR